MEFEFDDTCYYIDVVDNLISYYMQDTRMKDKLFELLEDAPLLEEQFKIVEKGVAPISYQNWHSSNMGIF